VAFSLYLTPDLRTHGLLIINANVIAKISFHVNCFVRNIAVNRVKKIQADSSFQTIKKLRIKRYAKRRANLTEKLQLHIGETEEILLLNIQEEKSQESLVRNISL
jgi:hypothetical protein